MIDYTHAYFILPISLWIAWNHRKAALHQSQSRFTETALNQTLFLAILILGLFAFILGWRFDYLFISTASLILTLAGLTGFLYGTKTLKIFLFPIVYLIFLIPLPLGILDGITLPMQRATANLSYYWLKLLQFPVSLKGILITLNQHEIVVGKPCSGFRSLITLLALGSAYVYSTKNTGIKKALLTLSIVPLALISNTLRVFILCLIINFGGKAAGEGILHELSGYLMFLICLLSLVGLDTLLSKKKQEPS